MTSMKELSKEILRESVRARKNYPTFNSFKEGYAVILEELDELWDQIKTKPQNHKRIREEAIQVGAMALRFLYDLCLC